MLKWLRTSSPQIQIAVRLCELSYRDRAMIGRAKWHGVRAVMQDVTGKAHQTRLLVLGASGKLGRTVRAAWRARPPDGIAPIYQARDRGADPDWLWSPGDPLGAVPKSDVIVGLWGVTCGDAAALGVNAALAAEAARIAAASGARRVLHLSSAAVYGTGRRVFAEADAPAPTSDYGRAKSDMEQAVPQGPEHVILRLGNVVGTDSLAAALARDPVVTLDRFADGQGPRRSYISPRDLAEVIRRLALHPDLPRVINVASSQPVAMAALLDAQGVPFDWRPAPRAATAEVAMDTRLLHRLLGDWAPATDAADIVGAGTDQKAPA